jgi:RNA polymerase sigma factor (sigma-70 family)
MANTPHEPPNELIPTDWQLLAGCQNPMDQSSWERFYQTYRNLIYGVALKGGLTAQEAEDVVQETMASVAKNMPGFRYDPAIGSFKAWLLNITRWRITDQLRKRGPTAPEPELPEDTEMGLHVSDGRELMMPELERIWDDEWKKNLTEAALVRVRRHTEPKQYQIFDFYVNKEWDPERVAKAFGVAVGQVYVAKSRIMELVDEEVKRLMKDMI